jgi:hypothetical protein
VLLVYLSKSTVQGTLLKELWATNISKASFRLTVLTKYYSLSNKRTFEVTLFSNSETCLVFISVVFYFWVRKISGGSWAVTRGGTSL